MVVKAGRDDGDGVDSAAVVAASKRAASKRAREILAA
jgi:hypothetical protein